MPERQFNSRSQRVRFAIRKKYITDEEWTNAEIAQELGVSTRIISEYLNETPQAEEIQKARSALEEEEWKQMVVDLKQRIDRLSTLEDQLWDVVEPTVTAYELVPTEAEIADFHLQDGGNSVQLEIDEDNRPKTDVEIPVPASWQEVPEFSRLRSVWEERRKTEEQLANILGLTDDTVSLEGEITERKIFELSDDEYPDTEPHEIGEEPEAEEEESNTEDTDEENSS